MVGPLSGIEILEARIAPAIFFVSGAGSGPTALHVYDEGGNPAGDGAAQEATGATAALLFHGGDKLIFHPDHNHLLSPGESTMVSVTEGSAMAFLSNGTLGERSN